LLAATRDSWSLLSKNGRKIAYIHIWSWTSLAIQQAVTDAIAKSNAMGADAFVLDLRDGWGGADPNYLNIFNPNIPVLEEVDRTGKRSSQDAHIRRPAVILTNGGTRSGKEVIAYGAKKHHLATLVGEPTAGAVTFGQPFCLTDGSLLLLAVADAYVDGEHLEGVGVKPDTAVHFDFRYAGGNDSQLDAALDLLAR
jgi:carboxyl-terminal processing protease